MAKRVIVIGAGIVGVSCSAYLKRDGHDVWLVDREGPAAGASYGNAGALSPGSCIPLAMPGILAGIVFTFVPMLGDDVVSKIIGGQRVVMLSGAMLDLITALNYSVAAAMSAFVILLVAALQILFVLTIRRIGGGAAMIEGLRR